MLGVIDGGVRHVTAVALEASRTLFLSRSEFNAAVENRAELKARIISLLCREVRMNCAHLEATIFLTVPAQLARRILNLQERHANSDDLSRLPSLQFSHKEYCRTRRLFPPEVDPDENWVNGATLAL